MPSLSLVFSIFSFTRMYVLAVLDDSQVLSNAKHYVLYVDELQFVRSYLLKILRVFVRRFHIFIPGLVVSYKYSVLRPDALVEHELRDPVVLGRDANGFCLMLNAMELDRCLVPRHFQSSEMRDIALQT